MTVRSAEHVQRPATGPRSGSYGGSRYEYDHLVPLELGGAANDPRNVWPEPGATPNPKDELEGRLNSMVCDGEISLAAAQREIANDWLTAYRSLVG